MSIPPVDYREDLDPMDPLLLERQRRRYASRAIAYLVLLNGVAALILLAGLTHLDQVTKPTRMVDAMLLFGAGAAIALASTFFAYLRRTVRIRAPERIPLRVILWWLSVMAAVAAAGCFLVGLNMAGRAALPERAEISSGAKFKGEKQHKDQSQARKEDRNQGKQRENENKRKIGARENSEQNESEPDSPEPTTETLPGSSVPLSRIECEQAGHTWNESSNTCG